MVPLGIRYHVVLIPRSTNTTWCHGSARVCARACARARARVRACARAHTHARAYAISVPKHLKST